MAEFFFKERSLHDTFPPAEAPLVRAVFRANGDASVLRAARIIGIASAVPIQKSFEIPGLRGSHAVETKQLCAVRNRERSPAIRLTNEVQANGSVSAVAEHAAHGLHASKEDDLEWGARRIWIRERPG